MNASTKKSLSLLVALSSAVACGAFVGCSSSDTTNEVVNNPDGGTTPTGDASTPPTGDGSTPPTGDDASPTGDDDATAPVDAGPPTVLNGSVVLSQSDNAGASFAYSAFAVFAPPIDVSSTIECGTPVPIGTADDSGVTSCTYVECTGYADAGAPVTIDAGDAGDAAVAEAANAGTITITGSQIASAGLQLVPNTTSGLYTALSGSGEQFLGASSITFSAAGDLNSVPAFNSALTAPSDVTITTPAKNTAGYGIIATGTDLAIAWSGGTAGTTFTVKFIEGNLATPGASKTVTCAWDAATHAGTIPSAGGLANFDSFAAGNATYYGSVSVSSTSSQTQTVSNATGTDGTVGNATVVTELSADNTAAGGTFTTQ